MPPLADGPATQKGRARDWARTCHVALFMPRGTHTTTRDAPRWPPKAPCSTHTPESSPTEEKARDDVTRESSKGPKNVKALAGSRAGGRQICRSWVGGLPVQKVVPEGWRNERLGRASAKSGAQESRRWVTRACVLSWRWHRGAARPCFGKCLRGSSDAGRRHARISLKQWEKFMKTIRVMLHSNVAA